MALREQTEARLVGFDQLGASLQVETLRAIEADLRRALSADVPSGTVRPGTQLTASGNEGSGARSHAESTPSWYAAALQSPVPLPHR